MHLSLAGGAHRPLRTLDLPPRGRNIDRVTLLFRGLLVAALLATLGGCRRNPLERLAPQDASRVED